MDSIIILRQLSNDSLIALVKDLEGVMKERGLRHYEDYTPKKKEVLDVNYGADSGHMMPTDLSHQFEKDK